jgi:hypothetical protein
MFFISNAAIATAAMVTVSVVAISRVVCMSGLLAPAGGIDVGEEHTDDRRAVLWENPP